MVTVRELAEKLFDIDFANSEEIPVERDGQKAYLGWNKSSGEAGDCETSKALSSIDEGEFIKAWEEIYAEEYSD